MFKRMFNAFRNKFENKFQNEKQQGKQQSKQPEPRVHVPSSAPLRSERCVTKRRRHMSFSARVWHERVALRNRLGIDRWNSNDINERTAFRNRVLAVARGQCKLSRRCVT